MRTPLEKRFQVKRHLSLPIDRPLIPERIVSTAKELDLPEKAEFHISVVVTKNAQIVWRALEEKGDVEKRTGEFRTLFESFEWQYELTDEYYLQERAYSRELLDEHGDIDMEEHVRLSIAQKVILPDLVPFYEQLNAFAGTSVSVPVPHITLFARLGRGIGINSVQEFDECTVRRL